MPNLLNFHPFRLLIVRKKMLSWPKIPAADPSEKEDSWLFPNIPHKCWKKLQKMGNFGETLRPGPWHKSIDGWFLRQGVIIEDFWQIAGLFLVLKKKKVGMCWIFYHKQKSGGEKIGIWNWPGPPQSQVVRCTQAPIVAFMARAGGPKATKRHSQYRKKRPHTWKKLWMFTDSQIKNISWVNFFWGVQNHSQHAMLKKKVICEPDDHFPDLFAPWMS